MIWYQCHCLHSPFLTYIIIGLFNKKSFTVEKFYGWIHKLFLILGKCMNLDQDECTFGVTCFRFRSLNFTEVLANWKYSIACWETFGLTWYILVFIYTVRLILWTVFSNWCYFLESKCWKAEFCKILAIVGDFLFWTWSQPFCCCRTSLLPLLRKYSPQMATFGSRCSFPQNKMLAEHFKGFR